MSIPVSLERLRAAVAERGPAAYVLTVSGDGSPHAVHACVAWDGDALVADVGPRSGTNATARPSVSLLYPLRSAEDYSLIVDGTAVVASSPAGQRLVVTPTRAVLHRAASAPAATDAACQSDCIPLQETKR